MMPDRPQDVDGQDKPGHQIVGGAMH